MKKLMLCVALAAVVAGSQLAVISSAHASAQMACMSDYKKFCSNVERGGGRVKKCFMEHRDELSPGCREAMDEKLAEQKAKETETAPTAPATTSTEPQANEK